MARLLQHNPLRAQHGDIAWAHVSSPDLVRWTEHPIGLTVLTADAGLDAWGVTAGLAVEGPPPALSAGAVAGYAYLSLVGSALAYTLWFRGLERLPATSVSLLGQLSPVVAATLGWALLGQRLTPVQLLGMALALAGVAAGVAGLTAAAARPGQVQAVRRRIMGAWLSPSPTRP